jgi:hypothetical protein
VSRHGGKQEQLDSLGWVFRPERRVPGAAHASGQPSWSVTASNSTGAACAAGGGKHSAV